MALALSEQSTSTKEKKKREPATAQDWMEQRVKGMKGVSTGLVLLLVSLLVGLAMAFFIPREVRLDARPDSLLRLDGLLGRN